MLSASARTTSREPQGQPLSRSCCVTAEPPEGCSVLPWVILCLLQGCAGMFGMAKSLLPAPGCQQQGHLSPPRCSLFNIYAARNILTVRVLKSPELSRDILLPVFPFPAFLLCTGLCKCAVTGSVRSPAWGWGQAPQLVSRCLLVSPGGISSSQLPLPGHGELGNAKKRV